MSNYKRLGLCIVFPGFPGFPGRFSRSQEGGGCGGENKGNKGRGKKQKVGWGWEVGVEVKKGGYLGQ